MENIILASQSPRRQEILSLGGYEYKVCVSSAEEQIPPEELENLTPQELVEKLARVKAEDAQVAEELGISTKTVDAQLQKATIRLKEILL